MDYRAEKGMTLLYEGLRTRYPLALWSSSRHVSYHTVSSIIELP